MKSFLESNLAALSRGDPALAERMRALPWPQPGLTVFPARSGAPTLRAVGQDGLELLLHSEYDPVREARQFLEVRNPENNSAYLLNGFGLGYLALATAAQMKPRRWIACVEAHEGLFRAALECVDLTPLIARPRVRFFVGKEWALFQRWLKSFLVDSAATDLGLIDLPACLRLFPSFYADVAREVQSGASFQRMDWVTLVRYGRDLERNAIRNLPTAIGSLGVKDFEGLLPGVPAVVVGAGPSLNSAIPHLRQAQHRCVLVSVGRALKRLLHEGIVPHFVVTLDMGEEVMSFFRGFEIPSGIGHLYDFDSYHGASLAFPGFNVVYHANNYFSLWCRTFLGDRGSVDKGNTVAHLAFQFAHVLGARPILLVGVDLAFPGEQTHADGVPQSWGGRTEDLNLDWVTIPGTRGQPVRSDTSFAAYVTGFEIQIAKTGAQVVQTSEIGAAIRGTEHVPLPEALDRWARSDAPIRERVQSVAGRPRSFDANAFREGSERLVKGLEGMMKRTDSALHLLGQIRRLDPANRLDQPEILRKLGILKEEEAQLTGDSETFPFLGRLLASADREIRLLARKVEDVPEDDPERLRIYSKMFETSFSEIRGASEFLLGEFRPVREEILRSHPSGSGPKP